MHVYEMLAIALVVVGQYIYISLKEPGICTDCVSKCAIVLVTLNRVCGMQAAIALRVGLCVSERRL